jgi:hypothetical protein
MFHGTIVGGRKGLALFWEKEWKNMCSMTYDEHILSRIQAFMEANPGLIFMQDNAPYPFSYQSIWPCSKENET